MVINLPDNEVIQMADEAPLKPGWLTAAEVCEEFGITEGNLRHWRDKLELRTQPVGKFLLVYWQEDINEKLRPALEKAKARGRRRKGEQTK